MKRQIFVVDGFIIDTKSIGAIADLPDPETEEEN